ncbi:MAG: hypothetical protein HOI95_29825 [Chromatiales bacterium]|jgi:hypothetical protein|nr:hypothetical protein [Chromatiales bacterium]
MADKPTFTLGVEEEYHVVERDSGELIAACPPAMAEHFKREWGPRFSLEFLQSQIEVMTLVHHSMGALRQELALLRRTAADIADNYGFDIVPRLPTPGRIGSPSSIQKALAIRHWRTICRPSLVASNGCHSVTSMSLKAQHLLRIARRPLSPVRDCRCGLQVRRARQR